MRWKNRKLLTNLADAVEAICGPPARRAPITELAEREGLACLAAAGIEVATAEEDEQRRGDLIRMRPVAGQAHRGGSSWQSLARGTGTIETDYLNGEIVLLGSLHGLPTPVDALLQRLATELARHREPPGGMTEASSSPSCRDAVRGDRAAGFPAVHHVPGGADRWRVHQHTVFGFLQAFVLLTRAPVAGPPAPTSATSPSRRPPATTSFRHIYTRAPHHDARRIAGDVVRSAARIRSSPGSRGFTRESRRRTITIVSGAGLLLPE